MAPTVVKLGGSAVASPDLGRWIAAIEASFHPTVLVPGGGPFADTVRAMQPVIGYDDAAAHAMAVLAMEQYAHAILHHGRRLVPAATHAALNAALSESRIPLWLPARMVLADPDIARDWSVTSDSLAAWLAGRLGAARLLLVKQADAEAGADLPALQAAGLVDPSFAAHLPPETALHLCGPADLEGAAARFADGALPGQPVPRATAALQSRRPPS